MQQNDILAHLGIDALSPMQEQAAQACADHRQLVLLAPTGTGKTLAYLLPVVEELMRGAPKLLAPTQEATRGVPSVLVLVPTHELAAQTAHVVKAMQGGIRVLACYGGRPVMEEQRLLRTLQPQLVVATPGRAADHLREAHIDGTRIRTLVIDEFDKCLQLGFQRQMSEVIDLLPRLNRRILLSATDDPRIPAFAGQHFHRLDFTPSNADPRLRLHALHAPQKDKLSTLRALLCHIGSHPSIVFVSHRQSVGRVASYLSAEGFAVSAFHGGLEQSVRERALARFAGGSALTLVATDLAARGLDIPGVEHVVHYHLPLDADTFTHRNGRSARWDSHGEVWMILAPDEQCTHLPTDAHTLDDLTEADLLTAPLATPPQPLWITLYIGRGKRDKVSKGDVAGFLSKVGGLSHHELGRIDVADRWAYAAVARQRAEDVLLRVQGQKIKGMKTIVQKTH